MSLLLNLRGYWAALFLQQFWFVVGDLSVQRARRRQPLLTHRAGGVQVYEALLSRESSAALCGLKYYIATVRFVQIYFLYIPNITGGVVLPIFLPFKGVAPNRLATSTILIPSFPACTFI